MLIRQNQLSLSDYENFCRLSVLTDRPRGPQKASKFGHKLWETQNRTEAESDFGYKYVRSLVPTCIYMYIYIICIWQKLNACATAKKTTWAHMLCRAGIDTEIRRLDRLLAKKRTELNRSDLSLTGVCRGKAAYGLAAVNKQKGI